MTGAHPVDARLEALANTGWLGSVCPRRVSPAQGLKASFTGAPISALLRSILVLLSHYGQGFDALLAACGEFRRPSP